MFGRNKPRVSGVVDHRDEIENLKRQNSAQRAALDEIERVMTALAEGDFEPRIVDWHSYGEQGQIMMIVNKGIDLMDAFLREAGAALEAATQGRFERKFLTAGMPGSFSIAATKINAASNGMQEEIKQRNAIRRDLSSELKKSVSWLIDDMQSITVEANDEAKEAARQADATLQLSATVAAAAEEAAVNVQTVASAAEELSASVEEISSQVTNSSERSASAADKAAKMLVEMDGLSKASEKIGAIISLINDIADQTNLLALNATIEAARAGEAGKGFAVVAGEVKSLAKQTGEATSEIGAQIEAVQQQTQRSVDAVQEIEKAVNEISEIATAIAASTDEQAGATLEISRNIQEAFKGTSEVSDNIATVSANASRTAEVSSKQQEITNSLSDKSGEISQSVHAFVEKLNH